MASRLASARRRFITSAVTLTLLAAGLLVGLVQGAQTAHAALPSGFSDNVVLSGLTNPTNLEFAPDGTILIATKGGQIWSYQGFADPKPTLVADLSTEVDDYWDRGLLGLAVPSNYPTDNHLYVLYTLDAGPGQTAPIWNDTCPTPPGPNADGCVVTGRLSQLTLQNGVETTETPLITDWCQQFPSHSIGTVLFGNDGYLYAGGGDGSSFQGADYGQLGGTSPPDQANPCGDPPSPAGTALTTPSAEGGALRAQSPLRTGGPTVLGGTIIRVDTTGAGATGNPWAGNADLTKARVLAYGLRNPFRFTTRPGTNQLWVGDVGDATWEEIDQIPDTTATTIAPNFGWPCYEGPAEHGSFSGLGLTQCTNLYNNPGSTAQPYFSYNHGSTLTSDDTCPTGSSSITGMSFYEGSSYPASLHNALFFADHSRQCMWAMLADKNGNPDPNTILALGHFAHPVQIIEGPAAYHNDLFYVDMDDGTIHELTYTPGNQPPTAIAKVTPTSGTAPLTVSYNATGSSDPQSEALTYAWAFGDGTTSTAASGTHTYAAPGSYTAKLTVMDTDGLTGSASVKVNATDTAKITSLKVTVKSPTGTTRTKYHVGDHLNFSAAAVEATNTAVPASDFSWHLTIHSCLTTTNCKTVNGGTKTGIKSGTFVAPDHTYPAYLTIELTVTPPGSTRTLSGVLTIQPQTVNVKFATNQTTVLHLTVDGVSKSAPFTVTMVMGHKATISAPSPQTVSGHKFTYTSWSDKGAETHTIVAPTAAATRTANYKKVS